MKEHKKLIYIFIILFFVGGCKILEKKATEIKKNFGIEPSGKNINKDKNNSIEITVSCGEENNLEKYINEGWVIKKEYSRKKFVRGKQLLLQKIAI